MNGFAIKATVETTERVTGVDLPWESVIEPLASAFGEMAVKVMKRKQEAKAA